MLSNLPANLQPSTTLFYYNPQEEDVLLQQAALQQTGEASFVNGLTYDSKNGMSVTEQEKAYLYQNAMDYAQANDVQLGQALTQQQIGALTEPMLWYVQQTVPDPTCKATGTATCPTITALMPQVYLPANTSALSADGNILASDSLALKFGDRQSGGSILNTGAITSGGSLSVSTGTLTNQANQVDVGQIWTNAGTSVDSGYVETTGTEVQAGGFMSAAAGQMTLNVSQLNQIGGLLQEVNPDGSTNNAATQQLMAQVLQQLGSNFTKTTVSDNLHTNFVAAGGFGAGQLFSMVVAVALTALGMPILAAMLASVMNQEFSGQRFSLGQVLEAGAVALATEGLDSGLGLNNVSLAQVGGDIAHGVASSAEVLEGAGEVVGQSAVSAAINTVAYGGSFGKDFENGVFGNLAAVGAGAIGTLNEDGAFGSGLTQEVLYTAAHGALGCAASAAEGTGCAGGAIGGAASALVAPLIRDGLYNGSETVTTTDNGNGTLTQTTSYNNTAFNALTAGIATLSGGLAAGLAGTNAQAGATSAENEVLNNSLSDKVRELKDAATSAFSSAGSNVKAWLGSSAGLTTMSLMSANADIGGIAGEEGGIIEGVESTFAAEEASVLLNGTAATSSAATTTLYRAVGPAELSDIQATGAFQNLGSAEGKYFTTSSSAASSYAKQAVNAFGDPAYTTVTTKIPNSILNGIEPVTVDGGIPAYVVPNNLLPELKPSVRGSMAIPGVK